MINSEPFLLGTMKKWFPSIPFSWPSLLLLVLIQLDSYKHHLILGQSCGPRISPRQMKEIPCDLSVVSYCLKPGSAYPWSSVRRYIFDNQGFVKKMYGEQRQSQIIHDELTRINRKYKDVGSETSLRNARKKNFRHFRDHHETNQKEKTKNGDNTEIDPNITMVFNYMDELNQHNVGGDNGDDNEPFTYHQDYEVGLTTLLYLVDSASTTQSSTVIDNTGDTGQFTTTLDSNADDDQLSGGGDGEPQHQDHQDDDDDDDGPIKGYNACPITQEVVAPYWANNTRGETLALLNVYPFEQYIHWEKCSYEGEKMFCRDGCKCEQQFRLHRLLAFDPKNECRGIFADWFRFPGCCVCICYDNYNHERINNRKARL